jgi:ring-1,2-phenylacetyl-CoA epoxidase subunit PaaD
MTTDTDKIWKLLDEVYDPEIPVLSLVDLGVITHVELKNEHVWVEMTPTFVGCPALDFMKQEVSDKLINNGYTHVKVSISFNTPWNSDKISEKGKQALKQFGLAPPMPTTLFTDISVLEQVPCPRCNSENTELKNPFGPTLCRSIHFCNNCREAFEQFKPVQ